MKLTEEFKKQRGWFYIGKEIYYWRNCDFCNKEYKGMGKFYCSYTCNRLDNPIIMKGDKNINWKGGITPLVNKIRSSKKSSDWKREVFIRDKYTCNFCNKIGGKLSVDHFPISFSEIIHVYNISSIEESLLCEKLWDINNGRVLCFDCHKLTDTYAGKNKKFK